MSLTVGMLSWASPKTIRNTLESYERLGLEKILQETGAQKLIFFQEIQDSDRKIAEEFGYEAHGIPVNIGIANGYKALVELATGDLFLFLENDWELIEDPKKVLEDASRLLEDYTIDVAKLRHRTNPGHPLWSRVYEGRELDNTSFLLDSIHWRSDPDRQFPGLITKVDDWYFTTAAFANWTNNPTIFRTEWIRTILNHFGTIDVEIDMQPWWKEQTNIYVGQHETGLFTHNRLDR